MGDEADLFARLEAEMATDDTTGTINLERYEDDGATLLVDPDPATDPRPERPERRSLLPDWLTDRATLTAAAPWYAGTILYTVAFHAIRAPLYYTRLTARAPIGAGRLIAAWWRWCGDDTGRQVTAALTGAVGPPKAAPTPAPAAGGTRLDAVTYLQLAKHHRATVRARILGSVFLGAISTGILMGTLSSITMPTFVALAAATLPLLGVIGRSVDRPVMSRAVDRNAVPRLTSELVLTALGSLGIGELNRALRGDEGVKFPSPITRDGPGWRADIDLPPGVTAGDVIEKRDRLASGLRRPLGCVWPEVDPDAHAGRLILWVGDKPLAAGKPVAWPLVKAGRTNLFDPVPLGVDQRGRPVMVTMMFASGVCGAIPRSGKTFAMRLLALAGALDPRVEVHAYNLKGGSDASAPIAHAYRTGDDDDDIAYLLRDLRTLAADRRRRYKVLRSLPRDVCPESKVTDALADRRDLGLHPILFVLDECQLAFEHPEHGEELTRLVTDLVKAGPAVGIMAWCATQRPDAKSLPRDISANAVLRLALKVTGQVENDMILGTSAYKNGVRATMLSRRDRGVAILAGEADDPRIVRVAYIDGPDAEAITARARAARQAAGLLTGHAAGIDLDVDVDTTSVLDHLIEVWPADDHRVWCDDLATALAAAWPGRYDGWTGEQVTAAVKPHGITTVQVKRTFQGRSVNKRGLDLSAVREALRSRMPDLDGDN